MKKDDVLRLVADTIWTAYANADEDQEDVLFLLWETFSVAEVETWKEEWQ